MQITTLVLYGLALALAAALLLWTGTRILAGRRRRLQKSDTSIAGTETRYSTLSLHPGGDDAEYDPLAEADIYLTYGNQQMAIDTLTKAAQDYPEREDIQSRLAEVQQADKT